MPVTSFTPGLWTKYFYLAEEGLVVKQERKDKTWKFLSSLRNKNFGRNYENTMAFVCDKCSKQIDNNKPLTRSFQYFDPGRIPKHLPKLNLAEKLVLKKYVAFSSITKINRPDYIDGKAVPNSEHSKIYGHVIALPLSPKDIKQTECSKLRTDISRYIKITWIGTKESWNEARKMNALTSILDVDLDNVLQWTEHLNMTHKTNEICKETSN